MSLEAWGKYVEEVRSAALPREAEYIKQFAQKWQKKSRGQYVCLSPLRTERTPSFYVFEGGNRSGWHDFGTGESGDLFSFVEKKNGCSFKEAVDELARFCGLPTWEERAKAFTGAAAVDPEELLKLWNRETTDRQIFQALTDIIYLCHAALPDSVRDYLNDNYGLEDEFIDLEKIGYCPAGLWKGREQLLPQYTDEILLATGFFHKESGTTVFSQRIVFPYWKDSVCRYAIARAHHHGLPPEAVTLPEWDKAKYKKLPTFDPEKRPYVAKCINNDILWGEDCLRNVRGQVVYITEGVTDAAMLKQLGFNVLSPVTIRFRQQDVEKITKLLIAAGVKEVVILNDADVTQDKRTGQDRFPGLEGAKAMAAELWRAKIRVRIGRLPKPEGVQKVDVNEIGRDAYQRGGETEALETFRAITSAAETYPEFLVSELGADGQPITNEALGESLKNLAAIAVNMTPLQQADLIEKVFAKVPKAAKKEAKKTFYAAVREETVKQNLKVAATATDGTPASEPTKRQKTSGRMRGVVISEEIGFYERVSGDGQKEDISTFSLVLRKRIAGTPNLLMCRVIGVDGETLADDWVIPKKAWLGKRSFWDSFPNAQMQWTGDDDDVQRVYSSLTRSEVYNATAVIKSTGVLGRHGDGDKLRFVLPAGTLDRNGWMKDSDLAYEPTGDSNLHKRLPAVQTPIDSPEVRVLLKMYLEEVTTLHEPVAMATMLGWWMSTLFRPVIMRKLGGHPILNVFGRAGSGKTSILSRAFWPAFTGVLQYDPLTCGVSSFVQGKDFSASNAIAILQDEFKPSDMKAGLVETLVRGVRDLYNGATVSRGQASLVLKSYTYASPLALGGETRLDMDQALIERCVYAGLDGNWIQSNPGAVVRWRSFQEQPWHRIAPFLQTWSLRADVDNLLRQADILTVSALASARRPTVAERVKVGLKTVAFGLIAAQLIAAEVDANIGFDFNRIGLAMLAESLGMDEAGNLEQHVRDNFDDFLIDASIMSGLGLVKEETHYVQIDDELCLWVAGIEALRNEWRRSQGLPGVSPGPRALTRIASEKLRAGNSYITSVGRVTPLDIPLLDKDVAQGQRVRCVGINFSKVPDSIRVEPFKIKEPKSWGGVREVQKINKNYGAPRLN